MKKVVVRQETVVIPTYEIADYDKNPMFLEKRVYQGSSGRVYPHPVCEGVADVKTDKEYKAVFLENDYILVMILPELGGRIQRILDKTNGYDAVYYNEVVKPALVGLAGPWISGGIEFNWPQHHRPSTYDPVDYRVIENDDGSVTCWVGETEKMFHTKGMAGFTVYPDKAYVEIKGQVYNPTDRPQTFLWWANPAVAVNDDTQSVFPPDVNAVMDHGKRDVSEFPIAKGVYYKVDYAPGTDISRYKNIPVPTSYMAYHSDFDFIGNFDYGKNAGLMHVADHHVNPGKKQWTWGNGDFGRAWDRNLTDENGPYIELMTGIFTDNQPDFTYLKPYEEKTFTQYFMPYKNVGAAKNANTKVILGVEAENGKVCVKAYSPVELGKVTIEVSVAGNVVGTANTTLSPVNVYEGCFSVNYSDEKDLCVAVLQNDEEILNFVPVERNANPVPSPAEALPKPEELKTNEELFLAATHLEQYRHATYSPEDYYLEGLKRDATDLRINNGYGKYLYNKGLYKEAEVYFRAAVKKSTWKNPNPYDCEPYYNLGLALKYQGKTEEAFDAFYKATWDGSLQDRGFYQLACLASTKGNYKAALEYVDKSLVRNAHNMEARTLKTMLLLVLGAEDSAVKAVYTEKAIAFATETQEIDPLDHGSAYLLCKCKQNEEAKALFEAVMRGDNHNYIELALTFIAAGLFEEAQKLLELAPVKDEPMVNYYLYSVSNKPEYLEAAEKANSLYCFPNRIQDILVLTMAIRNGGKMAAYYLGNLYYDRGRCLEAADLWESVAGQINLPTVYRNLSLAYFNKKQEPEKAREALEKAFHMDESDARVFFELDQLYKVLNISLADRLDNMNSHPELLEKRDDLYTEYITLLNLNGEYENAYKRIMSHNFHPWEGGEGKIPAQYRIALINMAKNAYKLKAIGFLNDALSYPHNLGEGKLIGNLDNDIYYALAGLYVDEKRENNLKLAARGNFQMNSAMYYNDQPPEMTYYAALALRELGEAEKAEEIFRSFIKYGNDHMEDEVRIEYFAVSLPDFLIFNGDLNKRNRVHCLFMKALGFKGLGNEADAKKCMDEVLTLDCCHRGQNIFA